MEEVELLKKKKGKFLLEYGFLKAGNGDSVGTDRAALPKLRCPE
jgi:hypothetical protein